MKFEPAPTRAWVIPSPSATLNAGPLAICPNQSGLKAAAEAAQTTENVATSSA